MSDELTALADELREFCAAAPHDYPGHLVSLFEKCEVALRSCAAAQEQKPRGWQWNFGGTWHTVDYQESVNPEKYARAMSDTVRPFYLSPQKPQPATGCDDAIRAIEFAIHIEDGFDRLEFLVGWQHGDTSDWPEFEALRNTAPSGAEPGQPVAWSDADIILFAGRMRGMGLMKPQGYGQLEHEMVAKLLAEFPRHTSQPAPAFCEGVEIKPLVWRPHICKQGCFVADEPMPCGYFVWEMAGLGYWSLGSPTGREVHGGLEGAKAAAQADYEQRIRSAIDLPLAADSNASTEIGSLREKLSDALAGGLPHKSDCAVYLAPAYEPRPCDCGASNASAEARLREHKWFDPECHEKGCQSLVWRGFYETVVKGRADFREAFRKQRDQAKRLREALRNIAEGNLGGLPGQANYARIREVAREALSAHPNASDVTEEELERWLFNKGLTLSSRSISRALLDAHTVRRR